MDFFLTIIVGALPLFLKAFVLLLRLFGSIGKKIGGLFAHGFSFLGIACILGSIGVLGFQVYLWLMLAEWQNISFADGLAYLDVMVTTPEFSEAWRGIVPLWRAFFALPLALVLIVFGVFSYLLLEGEESFFDE